MSNTIKLDVQVTGAQDAARQISSVTQAATAASGAGSAGPSKIAQAVTGNAKAEAWFSGKAYYKELDTAATTAAKGGLTKVADALGRYGLVATDAGQKSEGLVRVVARFAGFGEYAEKIGMMAKSWNGVGAALTTATGALAAFAIGWKVGTWLREVTGLGAAIDRFQGLDMGPGKFDDNTRLSDQRTAFMNWYAGQHKGDMTGADEQWQKQAAMATSRRQLPAIAESARERTAAERVADDVTNKKLVFVGNEEQKKQQYQKRLALYSNEGGSNGSLDDWLGGMGRGANGEMEYGQMAGSKDAMDEVVKREIAASEEQVTVRQDLADKRGAIGATETELEIQRLDQELRAMTTAANGQKAILDDIANYRAEKVWQIKAAAQKSDEALFNEDARKRTAAQQASAQAVLGQLSTASDATGKEMDTAKEAEQGATDAQTEHRKRALTPSHVLLAQNRAFMRDARKTAREDTKLNTIADRAEDKVGRGERLTAREDAALKWRADTKDKEKAGDQQVLLRDKQIKMADDMKEIRMQLQSMSKAVGVAGGT